MSSVRTLLDRRFSARIAIVFVNLLKDERTGRKGVLRAMEMVDLRLSRLATVGLVLLIGAVFAVVLA